MNELLALMTRAPRLTLAVAESLTCGQVQVRIGAISGASGFFAGGLTAYSIEQKVRHLGVDAGEARLANGVSAEIAAQMARGACVLFQSDLALATTGYAEASAEWKTPEPFAWWALAHRSEPGGTPVLVASGRVDCPGLGRTEVQERVADAALAGLIDYLRRRRSG